MSSNLPPDPDRPKLPYNEGFKMSIRAHNPPKPFGNHAYGLVGDRWELPDSYVARMTRSELVLRQPPIQTPDPQPLQAAKITIIKSIATGDTRRAQLVLCNVEPQNGGTQYEAVAKIYDALYYPFGKRYGRVDVMWMADGDYSREAAAYEHLRAEQHTGYREPKYFGSWTLSLPFQRAGKTLDRPVRLILIEYLHGQSLADFIDPPNAFHYPEDIRLEVVAQVMDTLARQGQIGLVHGDVAARNIILVEEPQATGSTRPLPRVVLIDYSLSIVRARVPKFNFQRLDKSVNPLELYWDPPALDEFEGWISDEYFGFSKPRQKWLMRRFGAERVREDYMSVTVELKWAKD